jgi:hypothetical protein
MEPDYELVVGFRASRVASPTANKGGNLVAMGDFRLRVAARSKDRTDLRCCRWISHGMRPVLRCAAS